MRNALAGCATEPPPAGYGSDFGTPENPVPNSDGYTVRSRVTTPLGVASVTAAIANLQSFSQHGGTALLAQTTSNAATLATLPSTLRAQLPAWIDAELDKQNIGASTARNTIGQIATMAESVVDDFFIESQMTISPTGATHSLVDLNFEPSGTDVLVPIGGFSEDKLAQKPTATVGERGALELGDQTFGLAFGAHAWQGINLASTAMFGSDLTAISKLDCNTVATAVAAKCVGSSCVGHASDLLAVCQTETSNLAMDLQAALAPIVITSLRFTSGTAHLADDNHDGVAERIEDGMWDTEVDEGSGAQSIQIVFTAHE
jgi:hypothetical protein